MTIAAVRRRPSLGAVAFAAVAILALGGCADKHDEENLVSGKQLFVAKCGSCHTLARAGTKGTVGPDLDAAFSADLGEGMKRDTIHGIVKDQILSPNRGGAMPAQLLTGRKAADVAAYVAFASARSGQDSGLLASAVKAAGGGKPAVAAGGMLEIDADPGGQLAYVTDKATAKPGSVTIQMKNGSSTPHNIALEGNGASAQGAVVQGGGTSKLTVTLKPGTYTFYCQVPGHRQAGMLGTLAVA